MIYHIGVSGGKDSTALLLWAVHESGIPHCDLVATFCDTQNEADCTYEHVHMLSRRVFPIAWLASPGFKEITRRHGFFPTEHRRFCTRELKLQPTKAFIEDLSEYGEVIAMSGVRAAESDDRAKLPEWGSPLDSYFGVVEYRPLLRWSRTDVLAIHDKYNIPLNPLYSKGALRVGCWPCINASKPEIRALAQNSPERIDYIRDWELSLENERGYQSFFAHNKVPPRFRSEWYTNSAGRRGRVATIDDVVRWSQTGRRAKQTLPDFTGMFPPLPVEPKLCLAHYSACE